MVNFQNSPFPDLNAVLEMFVCESAMTSILMSGEGGDMSEGRRTVRIV